MENEFEEKKPINIKKIVLISLGIIGVFMFIFVITLSISQLNSLKKGVNQPNATSNINKNPAFIYFSPPSIKIQPAQHNVSSDILLDTQEKEVGTVQLEISFDPKEVSNVSIITTQDKTSPFSSFKIIQTVVVQEKGKAFIVLSQDEKGEKPVQGKGKLAALRYDLFNTQKLETTKIEITPLTALITQGKEIKHEKTDLVITFPPQSSLTVEP